MNVFRSTDTLPAFKNAVVTIGTFDGVHAGHQKIIRQLKAEAARVGGETVIISFHPHPRMVIATGRTPLQLITTIDEKIALLEKNGIDNLVIVPFTEAFSQQAPEEYIEHFLYKKFQPHTVIIGYDHRFGQARKGDYKLLETYAPLLGFELKEIPAEVISDSTVSSTRIREAILHGEIELANALLGYDYFFDGTVIEGNKLGRTLGYPTANLQIIQEEKLIPGNGVFAVTLHIGRPDAEGYITWDATTHRGMMNIGVRPTVDGTKRTIEVNIFDFEENIYGSTLRVQVKKFLRGEHRFNGLEALKAQLALDKEQTLAFFR